MNDKRIEFDRYPSGQHDQSRSLRTALWIGTDRWEWVHSDEDGPVREENPPDFVVDTDQVNDFVVEWLRGPIGHDGPPGPAGPESMGGEHYSELRALRSPRRAV